MNKNLLETLRGNTSSYPRPIWFMRQAGRYLPEYLKLREKAGSFLSLCFNPDLATEVTLQPIRRFPELDGAILFSDILVIPLSLGYDVQFVQGEGPVVEKVDLNDLKPFVLEMGIKVLAPIFETIRQTKRSLSPEKTFLGFAGGPWTVLSYMIAGKGDFDYSRIKKTAFSHPQKVEKVLKILTEATVFYLKEQIRAGVDAIQIFESWGGILPEIYFDQWVLKPIKMIVEAVHQEFPKIPIIIFPKGCVAFYRKFFSFQGRDIAISLDSTIDFQAIENSFPQRMPVQGGLDPSLLVVGGEPMIFEAQRILKTFSARPYIFNLGHGITPDTPIKHVEQLISCVKEWIP